MLRTILESRGLVAMVAAAGVGTWGLRAYPARTDDVFLALIELRNPAVFHLLAYGYATLWFTTPFFLASLLTSAIVILVYRQAPSTRLRRLPPYPEPETRDTPSLDPWRDALADDDRPCADADVADDPAARALHRHHDSRRGRHRQDVRVHVSVRRAAAALASAGSGAEDRRARPGSEGRLLSAGPRRC